MPLLKHIRLPGVSDLVRHAILGWLAAVTIEYLLLPGELRDLGALDGLARMSLTRVLILTAGIAGFLLGISCFVNIRRIQRWGMAAVFGVFAAAALAASFTPEFLCGCGLILVLLLVYARFGWNGEEEYPDLPEKAPRRCLWITAGLAAAFFLFVSVWTVCRVLSFSAPTYDFGIFSQMFYNMKESGLPMTTVERDGLLSHFDVHVSPIYYLLLPFYVLFPTPATLQVLQAAVLASAVIPLWLIGKHRGLSGWQRTLLCAALLLYPAFAGGTSYDIHENCFLTPLLLWLFYGIERKNIPLIALSALLTLGVKEDAAVYVAVIGLWMTVTALLRWGKGKHPDLKSLFTGAAVLAVSVGWFFLVTGYLAEHGDGVMTYRYQNFMFDGSSSLFTVIKAVLLNPLKAVFECLDPEKIPFLAMTLLSLLGLPLLTRRYERFLLLIPYILVNLMSDYSYQHDIFFQYTYGSTAFLFFLAAVNLADLEFDGLRIGALAAAAAVCLSLFCSQVVPKAAPYPQQAIRYHGYYQNIRDTLDTVPDGASVASTTFYTTHLSQREILYDIRYCTWAHVLEAEYVVLRIGSESEYARYNTGGQPNGYDNLVRRLEQSGYTVYESIENVLVIYHRAP